MNSYVRLNYCKFLVSDPGLTDWHIVEVEVEGPVGPSGGQFTVR